MKPNIKTVVTAVALFVIAAGVIAILANSEMARAAVGGVVTIAGRIAGVTMPVDIDDAATKGYVDAQVAKPTAIVLTNVESSMDTCPIITGTSYLACPAGYTPIATIAGTCNVAAAAAVTDLGGNVESTTWYAITYNTVCEK